MPLKDVLDYSAMIAYYEWKLSHLCKYFGSYWSYKSWIERKCKSGEIHKFNKGDER